MIPPYGKDYTDENGEPLPDLLAGVRDGAWLDAQDFPALRYAVPGVIPEGFTLMVGPPKAGKSWLALAILLAVATGGRALGRIQVPKGRVLYLALEDGHRRMQDRCRTLMSGEPLPVGFCYLTRLEPVALVATIEAFIERHPDVVLVVLDTLGRVMPPAMPNETTYSRDYRVGARIKAIADSHPGLAVVVLHHDRKASSDDFVERVSGTNGLAGAADTIVVLSRERQSDEGAIAVTGRDVIEAEYALVMDAGCWRLDGSTLAEAESTARERAVLDGVGDRLADVIRYVGEHPTGVGPSDVAKALQLDPKAASAYLSRAVAANRIIRIKRGVYVGVGSVGLLGSGDRQSQHPTHPTPSLRLVLPDDEDEES